MAKYKTINYGDTGGDVSKLQKSLNSAGYNLDVDGIYGDNTAAAVKDYASKNGLNNVADDTYLTKLYGQSYDNSIDSSIHTDGTPTKGKYGTYSSGELASFNYARQDELDKLANELVNYKPYEYQQFGGFNYDPATDESYKDYSDYYTRLGQQAMQDTLGQVAARTGGYASSYAQAVAQQQYDNYIAQLASKIPELEQIAYNRAYQQWSDDQNMKYNQWNNNYNQMQNAYNTMLNERNLDYQAYSDENADWWNKYQTQLALEQAAAGGAVGGGSGGGSGRSSKSSKSDAVFAQANETPYMQETEAILKKALADGDITAKQADSYWEKKYSDDSRQKYENTKLVTVDPLYYMYHT